MKWETGLRWIIAVSESIGLLVVPIIGTIIHRRNIVFLPGIHI